MAAKLLAEIQRERRRRKIATEGEKLEKNHVTTLALVMGA